MKLKEIELFLMDNIVSIEHMQDHITDDTFENFMYCGLKVDRAAVIEEEGIATSVGKGNDDRMFQTS